MNRKSSRTSTEFDYFWGAFRTLLNAWDWRKSREVSKSFIDFNWAISVIKVNEEKQQLEAFILDATCEPLPTAL